MKSKYSTYNTEILLIYSIREEAALVPTKLKVGGLNHHTDKHF
jgi:hypothetical protein